MSFIKDDGKGFVGAHTGDDAFFDWPEFGEMIGGYFDDHPWGVFDAPVIVEDSTLPRDEDVPRALHDPRRNLPAQELGARQGARARASRRDASSISPSPTFTAPTTTLP